MNWKKTLTVLTAASLLTGCFAGCGKPADETKPVSSGSNPGESAPQLSYTAQSYPLGSSLQSVSCFTARGADGYAAGRMESDTDSGECDWESAIFHVDLTTGACENIGADLGKADITCLQQDAEGNLRAGVIAPDGAVSIWKLDGSGQVLDRSELKNVEKDSCIEQLVMDEDGNIYFSTYDCVHVLDPQGEPLTEIRAAGSQCVTLVHQIPSVVIRPADDRSGPLLQSIDLTAKKLGEKKELPENAVQVFRGFADYDYTCQAGDSLYGGFLDDREPVKLLNWLDIGIDPNSFHSITPLEDGRFIGIEEKIGRTEQEGEGYCVTVLQPSDRVQSSENRLTLACVGLSSWLKPAIVEFNRAHPDTQIVVRDYAEQASKTEAFTKLNTELMAGNIPDILLTNGLNVEQLADRGMLTDLWPMIDSDPELGRDKVMSHVLDAMAIDGKLYHVTDSFIILTATCSSDLVGSREQWTPRELMEIYDTMGPDAVVMGIEDTKSEVLMSVLNRDLDSFIDWDARSCSFDTPEFVSLLQFADRFPAEFDWENASPDEINDDYGRLRSGKQLMHKCVLDCCTSYQEEMLIHNGKTVFVGYPSSSGNGSCFATYSSLAITSACKNPEAAWSFIRQMLTGEMTENVGFPINRSKFDALFERAMTPYTTVDPQTGETVEEPLELYWGGILYAMTQAEYDGFMKVYESCNTVWDSTNRDELYRLIGQECAAFFAGQKSAEETARLIQDRVGLFIVEQG